MDNEIFFAENRKNTKKNIPLIAMLFSAMRGIFNYAIVTLFQSSEGQIAIYVFPGLMLISRPMES